MTPNPSPHDTTPLGRLWRLILRHPWLCLAGLLALQTVFGLDARSLWFSDEVRYAEAYRNLLSGHWLVLHMNGEFYPDKPPVYFWFLRLVDALTPGSGDAVFLFGAALSGFAFLAATMSLARVTTGDPELAPASTLVVLCTLYFVALTHYSRMDLLFAAFIVWAEVLFLLALRRERSFLAVAAMALCGVAVLTKGPLGALLPLAALLAHLAWTRNLRRLLRADMLAGFLLLLLLTGGWLAAAWAVEGRAFVDTVLGRQILERAMDASHHRQPVYHYLLILPAVWLPWSLVVPFTGLRGTFTRERFRSLLRERPGGGTAFLWISVMSGFVLLSALSGKVAVYLVPLFAPLGVLTTQTLRDLPSDATRKFWTTAAAFFALPALILPAATAFRPLGVRLEGVWLVAPAFAMLAAALFLRRKERFGTNLVVLALGLTLVLIPARLLTLPSLDAVLSPRATAERLGALARSGCTPLIYKAYQGVFTYYSGLDSIEETKRMERVNDVLARQECVALVMAEKYWKRWKNRPADLKVVFRQWIADRWYVLAARRPHPDAGGPSPDS